MSQFVGRPGRLRFIHPTWRCSLGHVGTWCPPASASAGRSTGVGPSKGSCEPRSSGCGLDRRFGDALHVGAYWSRTGDVEVDLVGANQPRSPADVSFVGSIKWRERSPVDRRLTSPPSPPSGPVCPERRTRSPSAYPTPGSPHRNSTWPVVRTTSSLPGRPAPDHRRRDHRVGFSMIPRSQGEPRQMVTGRCARRRSRTLRPAPPDARRADAAAFTSTFTVGLGRFELPTS